MSGRGQAAPRMGSRNRKPCLAEHAVGHTLAHAAADDADVHGGGDLCRDPWGTRLRMRLGTRHALPHGLGGAPAPRGCHISAPRGRSATRVLVHGAGRARARLTDSAYMRSWTCGDAHGYGRGSAPACGLMGCLLMHRCRKVQALRITVSRQVVARLFQSHGLHYLRRLDGKSRLVGEAQIRGCRFHPGSKQRE
jgi:hypothetical protein